MGVQQWFSSTHVEGFIRMCFIKISGMCQDHSRTSSRVDIVQFWRCRQWHVVSLRYHNPVLTQVCKNTLEEWRKTLKHDQHSFLYKKWRKSRWRYSRLKEKCLVLERFLARSPHLPNRPYSFLWQACPLESFRDCRQSLICRGLLPDGRLHLGIHVSPHVFRRACPFQLQHLLGYVLDEAFSPLWLHSECTLHIQMSPIDTPRFHTPNHNGLFCSRPGLLPSDLWDSVLFDNWSKRLWKLFYRRLVCFYHDDDGGLRWLFPRYRVRANGLHSQCSLGRVPHLYVHNRRTIDLLNVWSRDKGTASHVADEKGGSNSNEFNEVLSCKTALP